MRRPEIILDDDINEFNDILVNQTGVGVIGIIEFFQLKRQYNGVSRDGIRDGRSQLEILGKTTWESLEGYSFCKQEKQVKTVKKQAQQGTIPVKKQSRNSPETVNSQRNPVKKSQEKPAKILENPRNLQATRTTSECILGLKRPSSKE